MKQSIIDEIFYNLRENSAIFTPPKSWADRIEQPVCDAYDKLLCALDSKQIKLLENFISASESEHSFEVKMFFKKGFEMGVLLGVECGELSDKLPKLD